MLTMQDRRSAVPGYWSESDWEGRISQNSQKVVGWWMGNKAKGGYHNKS